MAQSRIHLVLDCGSKNKKMKYDVGQRTAKLLSMKGLSCIVFGSSNQEWANSTIMNQHDDFPIVCLQT